MSSARASLVVLAALLAGACSDAPKRPNVILVVVDTLRSDRLGCYGYARPTSPVIDALANEGALFEECVAQAPWTLQSMPSMWTGTYSTQHREWCERGSTTIAEQLHRAGYATIGASANDLLSAELQYDRGFDAYDASKLADGANKPFDVLVHDVLPKVDEARAKRPDAPLFLYVQPFDPHYPYREHHDLDRELPTDETEPVRPEGWQAAEIAKRGAPPPANDPGWASELVGLRHQRGLYDQAVRFTDGVLGDLLAALRERGLLENAVVAIVSDHGEGLWEHVREASPEVLATRGPNGFFFAGHAYHEYEEAIRTPFVVWGSGVPKGVRRAEPVENVDLYPTLCALAGVAPPEDQLVGRDLTRLFDAPASGVSGWREHTFAFMPHLACVRERSSGLKLLAPTCTYRDPKDGFPEELFHLPSDVDERTNLVASRPADVERLVRVLQETIDAHPTRTTWGMKKPPKIVASIHDKNYVDVGDNLDGYVSAEPKPPPVPRVVCD